MRPKALFVVMIWVWAGFILFVLLMLALDLGVFHRDAHVVSIREALGWSAVWGQSRPGIRRVRALRLRASVDDSVSPWMRSTDRSMTGPPPP
jgi:hypothetical protein